MLIHQQTSFKSWQILWKQDRSNIQNYGLLSGSFLRVVLPLVHTNYLDISTHHLLLVRKQLLFAYELCSFTFLKRGHLSSFSFISDTNDYSSPFITTTLSSLKSNKWTTTHESFLTSLPIFFLAFLHMRNNFHRQPSQSKTTTLTMLR